MTCGRDCSGGNDKNAVVFNKDTEQVIAILQGHTKKVTGVTYHPQEVRGKREGEHIQVICNAHLYSERTLNISIVNFLLLKRTARRR